MRLALLALAAFAAPASACWWSYGPPVNYYPAPPVYYYYVLPPVCVCPPMAPPQVIPNKPPEKMPEKKTAMPSETPFAPIVPATGNQPVEEKSESKLPKLDVPVTPKVEAAPLKMDPPKVEVKPELKPTPTLTLPKVEVKAELPKLDNPPVNLPKAEVKPELPKLDLPPPVSLPKMETPKIELPPLNPPAPMVELPPLSIPPVKVEKSISKSVKQDVRIFGVMGAAPLEGRYRIGFYNYSNNEIAITVNGQKLTLPAKSNVTATVERSFTWSAGDSKPESYNFTDGAAGAEVVIK